MMNPSLFLGIAVTPEMLSYLKSQKPEYIELFLRQDAASLYLYDLYIDDRRYFGKFLGPYFEFTQLEMVEQNIYSLLGKILPDASFKGVPLTLLSAVPIY